ncbi:MAG: hypothetical protein AAF581_20140 [Planctomycetota bacterium]
MIGRPYGCRRGAFSAIFRTVANSCRRMGNGEKEKDSPQEEGRLAQEGDSKPKFQEEGFQEEGHEEGREEIEGREEEVAADIDEDGQEKGREAGDEGDQNLREEEPYPG